MSPYLPIMILSVLPGAPTVHRIPDAVAVFQCDFADDWDVNFDRWPDGWTRARGKEYPNYLKIEISDEPSPAGNRCLHIELDGGAAAVYSPNIGIHSQFSYVLEASLKTESLKHNVAFCSVTFLDEQRQPLKTFTSRPLRDAANWKKIRLGPLIPPNTEARFARVGLHLRPTERADLVGSALFDDVWLARVPQLELLSNSPHNVYTKPDDVEVTCQVSGVAESTPLVRFEAIDASGRPVDVWETRLEATPQSPARARAFVPSLDQQPAAGQIVDIKSDTQHEAFVGSVRWRPSLSGNGFYRVIATMRGRGGSQHQKTINLAVIDPTMNRSEGEFGWTLPRGEQPLPIRSLVGLLTQVGINWVKFPVWFSDNDRQQADRLVWFADRLSNDGIELVGMLDQPPADARKRFGEGDRLPAAAVFADPDVWHPVLDPVMTRLSLKVQWWQIGHDRDTSFVGHPNLTEKIEEVKNHLRRFGQSIRLGIGWHWMNEIGSGSREPWDFLSLSETPSLTDSEIRSYLAGANYGKAQRWVVLQPLSSKEYDVRTRTQDVVIRMLAAKIAGAQRIFIPEPFSAEHGLMNEDGTPGELLLPWRTTALMISGTERIGSMSLPQGSHNDILVRGDEAIMVIWNESSATETIYLGEDVRQVDLWGRETVPSVDGHRQVIRVGPLPTFLVGVNPSLARWRLAFSFDNKRLSSIVGRPQYVSYRATNFFPQGVSGRITFVTPDVWGTPPQPVRFKLAAREELQKSFPVTLRADASSGIHDVRIDFEVAADQNYLFSVYRSIELGLEDIAIELSANLNQKGELIVEQRMINQSENFVSFNCFLFAPGRRRLRQQVFDFGRGTDKRTFVLPNGEELVGKTIWLRAEEIGGDRVLNHRLEIRN